MSLAARFVLSMTIALVIVVSIAGYTLISSSTRIGENYRRSGIEAASESVILLKGDQPRYRVEEKSSTKHPGGITSEAVQFLKPDGWYNGRLFTPPVEEQAPVELLVHLPHDRDRFGERIHVPLQVEERNRIYNSLIEGFPKFTERGPEETGPSGVTSERVEWTTTASLTGGTVTEEHVGWLFRFQPKPGSSKWIMPALPQRSQDSLFRIILVVMVVVVLVGAGVALWVGQQIVKPINDIIEDIRKISKGDLRHKTRVRGGGEIELLGRTVDRMTRELREAQEAELQLGIREREMEFAEGVREALLPVATPLVEGFDVGAAHMAGPFGGDFHDFVELEDGRVGLLVCDVSGQGVPAALIGATARAFLRRVLGEGRDVLESMRAVNRELVRDVRRGMFVTALYALIDPRTAEVQVICAGHKVPLLRYTAADKNLRLVQPDGIALGFDKGPVFDRRLELSEFKLEPGDRLLLANSGPVQIQRANGQEMGEKAFYACMLRAIGQTTPKFLRSIREELTEFAGENGSSANVSLLTVVREN